MGGRYAFYNNAQDRNLEIMSCNVLVSWTVNSEIFGRQHSWEVSNFDDNFSLCPSRFCVFDTLLEDSENFAFRGGINVIAGHRLYTCL